jgi:antitoxin component YwqK of YwqJK toxin-antitoxin module
LIALILIALMRLSQAEVPLRCPGDRDAVRDRALYAEIADHAIGCTDDQGAWDGPYQERFADGRVAVRGAQRHAHPEGLWTFFYANGQTMMRGRFRAGHRQGPWTSFYENGKRLGQGSYRDDMLDGRWTTWREDGSRESVGSYRRGDKEGPWTYFHPNGRPDRAGAYRGVRRVPPRNAPVPAETGQWTYWHDNGKRRAQGTFRNGEQIGLWIEWSPGGQEISRKQLNDQK